MPTYICDQCGCIDNTALGGNYYLHQTNPLDSPELLCTQCLTGRWHNHFPKEDWADYLERTGQSLGEFIKTNKNSGHLVNLETWITKHRQYAPTSYCQRRKIYHDGKYWRLEDTHKRAHSDKTK